MNLQHAGQASEMACEETQVLLKGVVGDNEHLNVRLDSLLVSNSSLATEVISLKEQLLVSQESFDEEPFLARARIQELERGLRPTGRVPAQRD